MRQLLVMWLVFFLEVVKRAFTPTPRLTDFLQVAVASALPAAARFAGWEFPATAEGDALAYIGLIAVFFLGIRILWAPYAIWKEQGAEIGALKLELSKPDRLIIEHLAIHRAKARAVLAAELEDYQTLSFYEAWDGAANQVSGELMAKIRRLQAEAGLSRAFDDARKLLILAVMAEAKKPNEQLPVDRESEHILTILQQYLVGDLTAEDLTRQLPPETALKVLQ